MNYFKKIFLIITTLIISKATIVLATTQPFSYNMSLFTSSSSPQSIAVGVANNVFITESGGVKKFSPSSTTGTLITTNVSSPTAIATDVANVYTVDQSGHVFLLTTSDNGAYTQTIIATNETTATASFVYSSSALFNASIGSIAGIAVDGNHTIYLSDATKHVIWKLTPPTSASGKYTLTLFAGTNGTAGAPGTGTATKFNTPWGIAFDPWGNLHVADLNNKVVQKLTLSTTGAITNSSVVAGQTGQYSGVNDGQLSTSACLYFPKHITFDSTGSFYLTNAYIDVVQYVSSATGLIKVIGGGKSPSNSATSYNGSATGANFLGISGIALDSTGNLYVTEINNNAVRKLTPN